jgi:hypothetical protein
MLCGRSNFRSLNVADFAQRNETATRTALFSRNLINASLRSAYENKSKNLIQKKLSNDIPELPLLIFDLHQRAD